MTIPEQASDVQFPTPRPVDVTVRTGYTVTRVLNLEGRETVVLGKETHSDDDQTAEFEIADLTKANEVIGLDITRIEESISNSRKIRRGVSLFGGMFLGVFGVSLSGALSETAGVPERLAGGGLGAALGYAGVSAYVKFLDKDRHDYDLATLAKAQAKSTALTSAIFAHEGTSPL